MYSLFLMEVKILFWFIAGYQAVSISSKQSKTEGEFSDQNLVAQTEM